MGTCALELIPLISTTPTCAESKVTEFTLLSMETSNARQHMNKQ